MSKKFDTIVVPCKDSKRDNNKMLDNGYWAGVKIAESRKTNSNILQFIIQLQHQKLQNVIE